MKREKNEIGLKIFLKINKKRVPIRGMYLSAPFLVISLISPRIVEITTSRKCCHRETLISLDRLRVTNQEPTTRITMTSHVYRIVTLMVTKPQLQRMTRSG